MCCVGDGRGRVGETLGRKPSRLSPKPEALAERSCRTAVLPGTAVERRTHPYTTKPSLGVPPLACAVGGGTCPGPLVGHPLHAPRDMPQGLTSRGRSCSQSRPNVAWKMLAFPRCPSSRSSAPQYVHWVSALTSCANVRATRPPPWLS